MAIQYLNKTLWSSYLLKGVEELIAFAHVIDDTGKYQGNKVTFSDIGSITIGDYVKDTDYDLQVLTDAKKEINLTQQKYFAVGLDDVDAGQTEADIASEVLRKGGNGFKKEVEEYIAGLHASAGIVTGLGDSTTPLEINSVNAGTTLLTVSRKLKEANANMSTLWAVIPPWYWEKLVLKYEGLATNNDEILANGYIGKLYGIKLYVSNCIANTAGAKYKILSGDGDAVRFGHNIENIEKLRNPNRFGDIIRGLYVFGGVVSQTATLACITANEAAEPAE